MEKWPTEYKLQYGWKNPAASSAPLVQAQEALSHRLHHSACPNKPANQDWSVESLDGDSCDAQDLDVDSSAEQQEPKVTTTNRSVTAAVKKRQLSRYQKSKTQPVLGKPSRVPQNATGAQQHGSKRVASTKTRNRPRMTSNTTTVKKTIEQDNDTSGSDTDSQTGQKVQPQQQGTADFHRKCGHKKKKKRNVKRKLVWPMITEYQSQYKIKEASNVADNDDDDIKVHQ